MNFTSIIAKNFLSFKELKYDFKTHPVLIQGENLTEIESQESNGSGKTALQGAVEYALLATTSRKVKDSELVFWGEKSAEITLNIHCPIRKETLVIQRKLFIKGSSKLELFIKKDSEESLTPVNFSTVNDGNKYILEWVGLSKEDIQNFFIINKERYTSFFSSSNAKKIDLISRFSNYDKINGVEKLVQEDVKKAEDNIRQLEIKKSSYQGVIDDSNREIEQLQSVNFEEEKERKIQLKKIEIENTEHEIKKEGEKREELKHKNEHLNTKIESLHISVQDLDDKIKELQKITFDDEYKKVDNELFTVNNEIKTISSNKKELNSTINEIEDIMADIQRNIRGAVVCPNCKHEFSISDPNVNIKDEKEALKETKVLYEKTKNKLSSLNEKLLEFSSKYNEINDKKIEISNKENEHNKRIREVQRQLNDVNSQIDSYNNQIQQNIQSIENSFKQEELLKSRILSINKQIEEIKSQTNNSYRLDELRSKIKDNEAKIRDIEDKIKQQEDKLYNLNQWVFNFKKFYGYLANKSLKVLQGYANKYLNELDSDLQIKWEGFKVKADGSLSEKITPYILRSGEIHDFWSFSGGERARLDFAMILTIQGVINSSHKYGGLNFLSLDEVLEGLDGLGLGKLMKSVKNLEKTILLTTHVTDRNVHSDILLIRKENGVSTLN